MRHRARSRDRFAINVVRLPRPWWVSQTPKQRCDKALLRESHHRTRRPAHVISRCTHARTDTSNQLCVFFSFFLTSMACTTYCYRNPLRTKLAYRLHHHGRLFRAREMSSGPSHFPSLFPGTTSGYTYKGDGRVFFCAPRLRLDSLRTLNLDASSGIAHCASISLPFHLSPNCIIKCPTLHCIGCLTASLTSPPHPTTRFRYLKKKVVTEMTALTHAGTWPNAA